MKETEARNKERKMKIRFDEATRILAENGVEVEKEGVWRVENNYFVIKRNDENAYYCGCADFIENNICKHVLAVEMFEANRIEEYKNVDTKDLNYNNQNSGIREITDLIEEDLPKKKITLDALIKRNFIISEMILKPSSYLSGDYGVIQIIWNEELYYANTNSKVVIRQIQELQEKLPFRCSIVKKQSSKNEQKSYYMLVPPFKEN